MPPLCSKAPFWQKHHQSSDGKTPSQHSHSANQDRLLAAFIPITAPNADAIVIPIPTPNAPTMPNSSPISLLSSSRDYDVQIIKKKPKEEMSIFSMMSKNASKSNFISCNHKHMMMMVTMIASLVQGCNFILKEPTKADKF